MSDTGRGRWLLLVTLIPAVVVWCLLTLMAVVGWCGISGCGSSGFGESTDLRAVSIASWLIGGLALAAPFWFAPWTRSRQVRVATGAAVGVAGTVAMITVVLA
ncbi:MAG: hypothetical protein V9E82_12740 [Candidatus Nanopelagicales bacterium]